MKVFNKGYNPKLVLTMLVLGATQFLIGCSKDNETKNFVSDGTKLIVNVMGITDMTDISAAKLKAEAADMPAVKEGVIMPKEMINFKAFDAQVSLEKDDLKQRPVSIGDRVTSSLGSGQLMAAALDEGITYRLLVYETDGTFVSSTQLVSGTPGEVYVKKGGTFNWYAVSYHNTDDIPEINEANPQLNIPENTDLLYASGTVAIDTEAPDGNVPLGIVFSHKFARVALELNTMGMFADMNNVGVIVDGASASTGTISLTDGIISNISTDPVSIDFTNFVDVEPPYKDRKVAYIYLAEPNPMSIDVTINALDIRLDVGGNRVFTNLAGSPALFNFTVGAGDIIAGGSYTAKINFIESPLTLAGVEWARQNLYYQTGHNPYRFHHTYAHSNARNTYFSFKGLTPLEYGTSVNADPCALVYPAGVWKTASRDDFLRLTGNLLLPSYPQQDRTYGTIGALGYYEFPDATGVATPYPGNNLRFNMNGGSVGIALVEDLIELDLGSSYGTNIQLWSADPVLGVGDLVWLGANTYFGARSGSNNNQSVQSGILNLGVLGIDLIESSFKNVRCVRAN